MSNLSAWRILPCSRSGAEVAPLLFKSETTATEYTIHVTDLVRLWTESLKRKDIIRRALELDTSIDPSEGTDQFVLLLHKLSDALDGGNGTSLSLAEKPDGQMALEATVLLPSPLPALVWPFKLRPATQQLLSSELVVSCLRDLLHSKHQVSSLLTQLKEKDHVISRLVDKLRSAGIELSAIFPSAQTHGRSKASTEDSVVNSVRGLREFDENAWKDNLPASFEPNISQEELVLNVFSQKAIDTSHVESGLSLGKQLYQDVAQPDSSQPAQQALSFPNPHTQPASPLTIDAREEANRCGFESTLRGVKDTTMDELNRSTDISSEPELKQRILISHSDESTASESDDNLEVSTLPSRSRLTSISEVESVKKVPKKIGVLGGKQREKTPPRIVACHRPVGSNKPASKIGRIGGKPRTLTTNEQISDVSNPLYEPNSGNSGATSSIRLKETSPDSDDGERSGRSSEKSIQTPEPTRETSEERADRKRLQLKRELEAKAHVPMKKKRKF